MKNFLITFLVFGVLSIRSPAGQPANLGYFQSSDPFRLPTTPALDFMRNADSVYVYHPVNDKNQQPRLHLIQGHARDSLTSIFVFGPNYYEGLYCVGEAPPDFGIEFRKANQKLDLECGWFLIRGKFNDRSLTGALNKSARDQLKLWIERYFPAK